VKMSEGKRQYLKKRRKSLLIALVALVAFGTALFILSFLNKKMNVGVVASGGFHNISAKLKDSLKEKPGEAQNILKKPLKLRYTYDTQSEELLIKKSFKIGKKKVGNPVFYVKNHGDMIYSYDFASDDENIFCRGVMKSGAEFFYIYYCRDKRD